MPRAADPTHIAAIRVFPNRSLCRPPNLCRSHPQALMDDCQPDRHSARATRRNLPDERLWDCRNPPPVGAVGTSHGSLQCRTNKCASRFRIETPQPHTMCCRQTAETSNPADWSCFCRYIAFPPPPGRSGSDFPTLASIAFRLCARVERWIASPSELARDRPSSYSTRRHRMPKAPERQGKAATYPSL